jgi:hypothetical protein
VENVRVIPSLNLNKKSKQVGESIADQQARIANEKKVNDAKKRVAEINKMKIQDNVKLSNYLNIKRPDKDTAVVEKKQAVSTQHTVKKPVVSEPMSKEAVAKGKQMSNTLVDRFAKDKSKSKITSMAEAEKLIKYRKTADELEEETLKAKYIVKPSTTKEAASKELDKNVEEAVHNKTFGIKTGKQLDTIIDDSKSQPVKQEEKQVVKQEKIQLAKQVVKQKEKAEPKIETKEDIKAKVAKEVKEQNYLKIPDNEAPKMSMKEDVVEKIVTNKVDKEEPKVAPKERRINPALLAEQERLKGSEDEAGGGVFTSNTEDKEK